MRYSIFQNNVKYNDKTHKLCLVLCLLSSHDNKSIEVVTICDFPALWREFENFIQNSIERNFINCVAECHIFYKLQKNQVTIKKLIIERQKNLFI